MKVTNSKLPGVLIIEPQVFGDQRGYFMESWSQQRYRDAGITEDFVQSNVSKSQQGVLRGLHFQNPNPQGKLVYVTQGEVYDVAVDIRLGSPTFGQYESIILSEENHKQFYVPEGFAHGFCVLSESVTFAYLCTNYYDAAADHSILWSDEDISIDWPIRSPKLSEKDAKALKLNDICVDELPRFKP
ncbi:dTDP-4-dehydrorhamnose 3,5-epimerase [Marinicella sp. S1101]|uniref:dTDP-4-dehydrorhamnose 3,5-epimerase n=1 Tax=Marinicella marina TaxID=2996016 RepID=UPI002260FDAC|nr:dTDP-4-dehydrorhamnose 3,5-epimerase [Marinicella marina]MCX7553455.1 dTDP-4-dehydrorhamnose 3,5-epimerase [Marinicella marina]MDJ1140079.1 dTDP-4-dehydrorhamnose 3,5-epimerase [Marinicella marina]